MVFNSASFLLLCVCTFVVFHYTRNAWRWVVLLAAGVVFYSALEAPHLLVALTLVIAISYYAGLWLRRLESEAARRVVFRSAVTANVLVLVAVRYIPFLTTNLNSLLGYLGLGVSVPVSEAVVSVGVSFYVFQAISYLSDVYLDVCGPEEHPGYFALYLSFFPKLLQGPIERASDLLPQLRKPYEFSYEAVRTGLYLFAIGLVKKVVIADRLGMLVDPIYGNVSDHQGLPLLLATFCYAFQIYFDFSGYTDMALGVARLFGVQLTNNFNSPYLATSVPDFWRRWHITFSRFILDYIFRPIQLYLRDWRVWGSVIGLSVTFLVSGIWHGASWNFVIWGAMHGVYMVGSVLAAPHLRRFYRALKLEKTRLLAVWQVAMTFVLTCVAWVFFRAANLSDGLYVVTHLFSGIPGQVAGVLAAGSPIAIARQAYETCLPGRPMTIAAILIAAICFVEAIQALNRPQSRHLPLLEQPVWVRWPLYYGIGVFILVFGVFGNSQYIYFGF